VLQSCKQTNTTDQNRAKNSKTNIHKVYRTIIMKQFQSNATSTSYSNAACPEQPTLAWKHKKIHKHLCLWFWSSCQNVSMQFKNKRLYFDDVM